jgi:hypothetical protein
MTIQINHFQISIIVMKAQSGSVFHKSPELFPSNVKDFSHSFFLFETLYCKAGFENHSFRKEVLADLTVSVGSSPDLYS